MEEAASVTVNSSSLNDEYVKSRMENGRYINSFNPIFEMPGFTTFLQWKMTTSKNTNLPADIEELNKLLPVIKPNRDEISKPSSSIRFVWIGHATCLVQMEGFMFLTDPVFKIGRKRYRPPALTVDDLPEELEAILISHNHFDHLDFQSVKSLNARYGNKLRWFCGQGGREWFIQSGIENVVELDWWTEWKHPVGYFLKIIIRHSYLISFSRIKNMFK
jgi:N-acyl-phosphatidylethanolamine-hydrolysing phospholipase D